MSRIRGRGTRPELSIATDMAEVERLVFHTHRRPGSVALEEALDRLAFAGARVHVRAEDVVAQVAAMRLEWGVGDGN